MKESRPPLTVSLVSLGCPKNLVDSEKMLGLLAGSGAVPTPDPTDADVIVINTCGFLEAARQESLAAIRQAIGVARSGVGPSGRPRRVVVAGCLATRMGRELLAEAPGIDAIVGVHQREQIVAAVTGNAEQIHLGRYRFHPEIDTARLRLTPRHYAYLRIADGCSRGCSFCTIPAIRGPARSKPPEAVLAEAAELIADGAVELNLIGQDTTGYGRDIGWDGGLAELLANLDKLPGVRWLRLLYAYPSDFSDRIIDAMADLEHVLPYVDLPLQHINDRILEAMRRRVTRRQIETLLAKLRARVPDVSIRTTFIAGFPGETEAEHRELLRFIEDFGFDMLGVFGYSPERSTPAARLAGQLPEAVKQSRRDELMAAQQRIVLRRNRELVGSRTAVLADEKRPDGRLAGRTARQAPEVDSVTILRPRRGRRPGIGELVSARIVGFEGYDLVAAI